MEAIIVLIIIFVAVVGVIAMFVMLLLCAAREAKWESPYVRRIMGDK